MTIVALVCMTTIETFAIHHQYTEKDGLLTREIHQIIELPNGQILTNCEGAFCLFDGAYFSTLPCERNRTFLLDHYANGYAHFRQGDSLIWLRDFYRLYLFDTRTYSFRYDIKQRLENDTALYSFEYQTVIPKPIPAHIENLLDSLRVEKDIACFTTDRQKGIWIGTRQNGILYFPPQRKRAWRIHDNKELLYQIQNITDSQGRMWHYRNHANLICRNGNDTILFHPGNVKGLHHNQINLLTELPDKQRFLMCYTLRELGYFYPERMEFVSLNHKIPELNRYRYFVGACPFDEQWTICYTQNGAFLLDTQADTISTFPPSENIEQYSDKYNCMLRDRQGRLWIGTQNGLFVTEKQKEEWSTSKIKGLSNNCIRSLIQDNDGGIWVGTSCGISRVSPSIINLSSDDGIPAISMTERSANCITEGYLAFECADHSIAIFHPQWFNMPKDTLTVVLTNLQIGNPAETVSTSLQEEISLPYNHNYLTFQFSALNYACPSHTHYRYRLSGMEENWLSYHGNGASGSIEYRALPPGKYIFQVQASLNNQEWGPLTEKSFIIHPPLWRTWWAKMIYALLLMAFFIILISIYLKRKRKTLERENDNRVNRLFELREEARHQFAVSTNIDPKNISINTDEEEFMARLLEAIRTNMNNADYNVDLLARDVAISRSNLYEKMRTILGITPSDFIRNVRLKHAARLLTETNLSISDIALQSGFNAPRIFSTHFKNMFGMLPSEYRGKDKENI